MSGTIVGIVDKESVINGKDIVKGDVLVGFKSNGLHTNGYSLARKVLFEKYNVDDTPEGFELNIGDELLKIHKSYLPLITKLKENLPVKGFSHITGGGIIGNTKRILPEGTSLKIDWNAWEMPEIFRLIRKTGNIKDEEMRSVFNLGIGLIAVIGKDRADDLMKLSEASGEAPILVGEVV